ncbi:MAG TPA: mechanosensitive ion channel domain-containing protein [Blastocatellia bacterium]|nr:mechanosensitive ion channel domain-containing protein [Blastocatellia bacterium]
MSERVREQAKQLEQQKDVREALDQTAGRPSPEMPKAATSDKLWFGSYVILLVGLGVLYYLFSLRFFGLPDNMVDFLLRYTRGAILIVLVLTLAKAVEVYLIGRVHDTVNRFNLRRILRLLIGLVMVFIIISVVFINWYTAVVSLGVVSLIFGFAMQTVLSSFIGWIYILVRQPYRVGDRIKIGDATGDVIDVSYLDTTLWEFGGQYLSTDHPSGRIIKFPNSQVLGSTVFNYSWPLFPYIWNEIKFNLAYGSDLEFVGRVMQETAEEEIGEGMMERVRVYRELLAKTPVDQLEVKEQPSVVFRVSENTWLEAIVRYLVVPKEQGRVKTRLIKKMLARLNAEPERAMFPKGDAR